MTIRLAAAERAALPDPSATGRLPAGCCRRRHAATAKGRHAAHRGLLHLDSSTFWRRVAFTVYVCIHYSCLDAMPTEANRIGGPEWKRPAIGLTADEPP